MRMHRNKVIKTRLSSLILFLGYPPQINSEYSSHVYNDAKENYLNPNMLFNLLKRVGWLVGWFYGLSKWLVGRLVGWFLWHINLYSKSLVGCFMAYPPLLEMIGCLVGWLFGWVLWLINRYSKWLVDWLIGWDLWHINLYSKWLVGWVLWHANLYSK